MRTKPVSTPSPKTTTCGAKAPRRSPVRLARLQRLLQQAALSHLGHRSSAWCARCSRKLGKVNMCALCRRELKLTIACPTYAKTRFRLGYQHRAAVLATARRSNRCACNTCQHMGCTSGASSVLWARPHDERLPSEVRRLAPRLMDKAWGFCPHECVWRGVRNQAGRRDTRLHINKATDAMQTHLHGDIE